jgi:hypothetical protein
MRRTLLTLTLLTAVTSSTVVPKAAFAQAQLSEAERKATARSLFSQGVKEQEAGRHAEALALFEKAQKLFDAPTHLLHIAQCQVALGKFVEAAETYETLKRVQLPPNSPDVFVQAKAQAETDLPAVRARIANLRVDLTPKPEQLRNLQLIVNDVVIPNELVGVARPVNPGPTKIVARAEGYKDASIDVTLKDRESRSVALALQPGQGTAPVPVVVPPPSNQRVEEPRPAPKHYDPETDKNTSTPKPPGTRIGLVYAPSLGNGVEHVLGAEFAFGKRYVRYHLTVAFATTKPGITSANGVDIEPGTIGVAIPVYVKDRFRLEIEPTAMLLNIHVLSASAGGETATDLQLGSGADIRLNIAYKGFFTGLSPAGFEIRYFESIFVNGGTISGTGVAGYYRPRIFIGGEF